MALFCLVYFAVDNTLFVKKSTDLEYTDSNVEIGLSVSCIFPTTDIDENGQDFVKEMKYKGTVVFFSSGRRACSDRHSVYNGIIDKRENDSGDILKVLLAQGEADVQQTEKCGKRGASSKLMKILKEMSDENGQKKNEKAKANEQITVKKQKMNGKTPATTKTTGPRTSSNPKLDKVQLENMAMLTGFLDQLPGQVSTVNVNATSSAPEPTMNLNTASSAPVSMVILNATSSAPVSTMNLNAASSAPVSTINLNAASSAPVSMVNLNATSSAPVSTINLNAASSAPVSMVHLNAASAPVSTINLNAASSAPVSMANLNATSAPLSMVHLNAASSAPVSTINLNAASSAPVSMVHLNAVSSAPVSMANLNAASSAPVSTINLNAASSAPVSMANLNATSSAPVSTINLNAASSAPVSMVNLNAASSAPVPTMNINATSPAPVSMVNLNAASSAPVSMVNLNAASPAPVSTVNWNATSSRSSSGHFMSILSDVSNSAEEIYCDQEVRHSAGILETNEIVMQSLNILHSDSSSARIIDVHQEENQKLRKENSKLQAEISRLKMSGNWGCIRPDQLQSLKDLVHLIECNAGAAAAASDYAYVRAEPQMSNQQVSSSPAARIRKQMPLSDDLTPKEIIPPSPQAEKEKMRVLVTTKEDPEKYSDIKVRSLDLYKMERKAASASDYLGTLLNEVIELVFTKDQLANAGGLGIRSKKQSKEPLDAHRVDAIRVYLAAKAKERVLKDLEPKDIHKKFTAKIGNARRDLKAAYLNSPKV